MIPKIIHKVILVDEGKIPKLPDGMKGAIDTWYQMNPGYEVKLYSGDDCVEYIKNHFGEEMLRIYNTLKPYSYRCDLMRHLIMYHEGGWYTDARMACLKPLDTLEREGKEFYVSIDKPHKELYMYTGFIGSIPNHPISKKMIDIIKWNVTYRYYGKNPLYPTGPASYINACIDYTQTNPEKCMIGEHVFENGEQVIKFEGMCFIKVKYNNARGGNNSDLTGTNNYNTMWENGTIYSSTFGQIYGRFFLGQYLGLTRDDTPDTATLSELIETYDHWESFVRDARQKYGNVQLFTMFETDDVHPHIIECMKHFDRVIVPFDYLKEILERHGVTCESMNYWSSNLIRSKPKVVEKKRDPNRLVFLYNGTNDVRKNVTTLTKLFARACEGTEHMLIVKTNKDDGLTRSKNIKIITERVSNEKLASLFNLCDYCITCTRGEGVSLLHLEGAYFGKPTISHDGGVFRDVKKFIDVPMISVSCKEVSIDLTDVPSFLHKVFYGKWWEVDEDDMVQTILKIIRSDF